MKDISRHLLSLILEEISDMWDFCLPVSEYIDTGMGPIATSSLPIDVEYLGSMLDDMEPIDGDMPDWSRGAGEHRIRGANLHVIAHHLDDVRSMCGHMWTCGDLPDTIGRYHIVDNPHTASPVARIDDGYIFDPEDVLCWIDDGILRCPSCASTGMDRDAFPLTDPRDFFLTFPNGASCDICLSDIEA